MDHDYLARLKQTHPALRLLNADNAPLIISFLFRIFIEPNRRSLPHSELVARLDDYLVHLRAVHGEERYPRSAREYLEDWANAQAPFLRKYYTDLSDEPEFDLTPATEKAIEWLRSLEQRQFVGTESRLMAVFQLLREIVTHTEQDPQARIAELERQKAQLDAEMDRIRAGQFSSLDTTQVKERYFHVEDTARKLLADFREVEYNFRALDRQTRERIATSDKARGELLDEIFAEHDVIRDSDQGKSFRAFWEFLMSPARQAELQDLLQAVLSLEPVQELRQDRFLERIKFSLLEAGEKVYLTGTLLVEQLRKYLDDQAYLDNKRIMELIRDIEKRAVEVKENPPAERGFAELDDPKPGVDLVMSRGLFTPPRNPVIGDTALCEGEAAVRLDALYGQSFIDEAELRRNIHKALQQRSQVSLGQIAERFPIRKGLAEVVGYLNLASRDDKAMIADQEQEILHLISHDDRTRQVRLPRVIFTR